MPRIMSTPTTPRGPVPAVTRASPAPRRSELARRATDMLAALQGAPRGGRQETTVEAAVDQFLGAMKTVAERTFPDWRARLIPPIEECCRDYETRRALLELHPHEDYYLAGVIALEAAKVRRLFPRESAELLSLIGERVSAVAGRADRLVSDLVFTIIASIDLDSGIDTPRRDYDQVGKTILKRMGVHDTEATRHLMSDLYYRHNLGEPLALGVPQWWRTFAAKYVIAAPARARA